MKASICNRYGSPDVLQVLDVPRPDPQPGEVLIRVQAATVNRTDTATLRAQPFFARAVTGLFRPKFRILGMDFAGTVEAVGPGVTRFQPGDRVFGMAPDAYGAHAEYLCRREDSEIAEMPAQLSFAEAVVCEGAWYANSTLDNVDLGAGQKALIYGASGAIGTAAVQLAKARGAEVTAVVSTQHQNLALDLGADHVVDYTARDFTATGERFDLIFDAVGKTSYKHCRKLLKPGGYFRSSDLGWGWQNVWLSLLSVVTGSHRVAIALPGDGKALVALVKSLLEKDAYRAVIDRTYRLADIADAYRYVEAGQKAGIVAIDLTPQESAGLRENVSRSSRLTD